MSDQRRHEAPELGNAIGRMLNALIRRAAEGDWEALEALHRVEQMAPAAATAGLTVAKESYSLAQLGDVVGTTRQAVGQRIANESWKSWTPIAVAWGDPDDAHALVTELGPCCHPTCLGMARCRERSLL